MPDRDFDSRSEEHTVDITPANTELVAPELGHILVVDDDPSLRMMIFAFLQDEGFSVQTAANGAEALKHIERQRPTLILLDMYMPVMDGWEFVRALRARGMDLPIVIVTAAHQARQQAQEIGAVAYVAKPVSLPLLLARLDAASRQQSA